MLISKSYLPTLDQRVDLNEKNIETLAKLIKVEYYTSEGLTADITSIEQSKTNVPNNTTNAWLIDSLGNYFLIVNTTSNIVYLKWYYQSKGEQGVAGPVGAQGPRGAQGVGIRSFENTGTSEGDDFTITHMTATLTDGVEEHFDVYAKHGEKGDTGATGPQGMQGEKGNTGISVESIAAGAASTAGGFTTTPVTFTLSDGKQQTIGVVAARGEKGDTGETGPEGPEGPAGSSAELYVHHFYAVADLTATNTPLTFSVDILSTSSGKLNFDKLLSELPERSSDSVGYVSCSGFSSSNLIIGMFKQGSALGFLKVMNNNTLQTETLARADFNFLTTNDFVSKIN